MHYLKKNIFLRSFVEERGFFKLACSLYKSDGLICRIFSIRVCPVLTIDITQLQTIKFFFFFLVLRVKVGNLAGRPTEAGASDR